MSGASDSPYSGMPFGQQPGMQPNGFNPAGTPWSHTGYLAPQMPTEPVLVAIGDISVTQTWVFSPSGTRPLGEVSWTVTDGSLTTSGIPVWAIIAAVITFWFFLLGLLFLLAKETTTRGAMQVTVFGAGFVHTTYIPVFSQHQVIDINARVNHARMLAAAYATPQAATGYQSAGGSGQPGATGQERAQGI